MPHGPWYISARAIRDYLAILGRADTEDEFARGERELLALAAVAATKTPKDLDTGALQYRGGRPLRLRFVVMPTPRTEGDLPQLVRVHPDNDGRRGGSHGA